MPAEPSDWILGPSADSIEFHQLLLDEAPTIGGIHYIVSYNWLEPENPIITVPGKQIPYRQACSISTAYVINL